MSLVNEILNISDEDFKNRIKNVFKFIPTMRESYQKNKLEFLKLSLDGHLPKNEAGIVDSSLVKKLIPEAQIIAFNVLKEEKELQESEERGFARTPERKRQIDNEVKKEEAKKRERAHLAELSKKNQEKEAEHMGISLEELEEMEKGLDNGDDEIDFCKKNSINSEFKLK